MASEVTIGADGRHEPKQQPKRKVTQQLVVPRDVIEMFCLWAARPGDCFMLTEDGELVRIENPQSEGQVQR